MVDATRDLILDCDDIELTKLAVPAWKDKDGNIIEVYIKQMSGFDAQEFIDLTQNNENVKYRNVKAIICSICDKEGNKLFTKEDIDLLNAKNSRVVNWLTEKILELNFKSNIDLETDAKN